LTAAATIDAQVPDATVVAVTLEAVAESAEAFCVLVALELHAATMSDIVVMEITTLNRFFGIRRLIFFLSFGG
jgi:hypothetical protein